MEKKKKICLTLIKKLLKFLAFSVVFVWAVCILVIFSTNINSASPVKHQSSSLKDSCLEGNLNSAAPASKHLFIDQSLKKLKRQERSITSSSINQSTSSPTTEINFLNNTEDKMKLLDPQEQWRRAVYGNNYLDELVLVGASTQSLYASTTSVQKPCLNDTTRINHHAKPMLDLLNSGIRYFELSAAYDHKQRLFYWRLPADSNNEISKREISVDMRQICPFARNHPSEMFIISLSYCDGVICEDYNNDRGIGDALTGTSDTFDDTQVITGSLMKKTSQDNDSFSVDLPTAKYEEFDFLNALFPHRKFWKGHKRKVLVEDTIASHFLTVVRTLVKTCAMPSDIPLSRTVAEMLATEKNVIFMIRSPNFLIPSKHRKIFRIDDILRRSIWSESGLNFHPSNGMPFNWLFPRLARKDNSRFFTQPFTLTHLKLTISTRVHLSSWFDRWPIISTAEFGCATFDIAFLLLVLCCFVFSLKKLIRRQRGSSRKLGSSVWLVTFYAVLALFHFLASYHAFQCFPRVILPFNFRPTTQMSSHSYDENLIDDSQWLTNVTTTQTTALLTISQLNSTHELGRMRETISSIQEKVLEEICKSIKSTFHRWLLRPNEKKINIISLTASSDELLRLDGNQDEPSQLRQRHDAITSQPQDINICTMELVNLANQTNLNLLKKLIFLKHSGSPTTEEAYHSQICPTIGFFYSVSSPDEKHILLSGSLDEGDEIIINENAYPINYKLSVYIRKDESSKLLLYSEYLQFLFNNTLDIYLRGTSTNQKSRSSTGFAYVSTDPLVTGTSCSINDLPRTNRTLKVVSWSS